MTMTYAHSQQSMENTSSLMCNWGPICEMDYREDSAKNRTLFCSVTAQNLLLL